MTAGARRQSPLSVLPVLAAVLAAFGYGLFFQGYADISYAPAILLLLAAALAVILPGLREGLTVPVSGAALLLFAFWLYTTFSLFWSTVPFVSLITYLVVIALPLVFLMFSIRQTPQEWLRRTAAALMAALTVLGAWAVCQVFLPGAPYGPRAHHPLLNSDNLAIFLDLGLVMAFAFIIGEKDRRKALALWLPSALILFGGLIATGSRAALICFGIAAVVAIILLRPAGGQKIRRLALAFFLMALVFAGIEAGSDANMAGRMAGLAAPMQDSAISSRVAVWSSALAMLREHPWGGTGLGTFYLYYPAHRSLLDTSSAGYWAHMDPLQFGAEMGLAAPLLFYAFLFAVFLRTAAALRACPADDPRRLMIVAPFCALLALAIHIHSSFDLYVFPILIVAGVWLALWHAATAQILPQERSFYSLSLPAWGKVSVGTATVIIAALIALMAASSAAGIHYLQKARAQLETGSGASFLKTLNETEKFAPASFIDPEVHLAGFYIDLLNNAAGVFSQDETKNIFNEALALLNQAESMNPVWAEIDYKRARLYLTAGDKDKAVSSLQRALAKNPMLFKARTDLAALYVNRGRVEEALALLTQGLRWPHGPDITAQYGPMIERIAPLVDIKKNYLEGRSP